MIAVLVFYCPKLFYFSEILNCINRKKYVAVVAVIPVISDLIKHTLDSSAGAKRLFNLPINTEISICS